MGLPKMNNEQAKMTQDYFGQYDDIIAAVMQDQTPNSDMGMDLSCAQMAKRICQVMDWDKFDVFGAHDFPEAYKSGTPPAVLVHGMIALLRVRVFERALVEGVGLPGFNDKMLAYAMRWNSMLFEKWNANRAGKEPSHKWNN